tara:strand:+ start:1721 stop:2446 length:726 start_codon:yes stop_codon:yes gene_type:complete
MSYLKMNDYSCLKGKTAFITGATGAIGGEIAQSLSSAGVDLLINGTNLEKLQQIKDKLTTNVHIIDGDISEQSEVERILYQSISLGKVDILINCAGVFPQKPISELDTSEYQKIMNINLNAPYFLSAGFSKDMIKNGWGRIVNIGSASCYGGYKNTVAYCSSKHGLLGMSLAMHDELKEDGVRVYCISPSSTQGDMGLATKGQDYSTFLDPKEVADYVLFAISQDGNAMSQEIFIKRMHLR